MPLRRSWIAAVALLLVVGVVPAAAASPAQQRLIVIETIAGGALSPKGKERLHQEIADVVSRNRLFLVSTETLPERLRHCEVPGCLSQVAAASGAMLVLAVDGIFAKESFKLTVSLWNADESRSLGKDNRDCPICDEQDLWGTAALVTQGLLERYGREEAARAASRRAPGAPPTANAGQDDGRSVAVYSGLAMASAGLATAAVGVYYIAVDGRSACDSCDRVRDTRKYGLPLAIGGGVAALAGAGLLTWALWPQEAQVEIGLGGLWLNGRFQ